MKIAKWITVAALATSLTLSGAVAANASSDAGDLESVSVQQEHAIEAWVSGASATTSVLNPMDSGTGAATRATGTSSMKLYRGSWLMWGEERVNFGWASGGKVTWSEAYQASGQVAPNWVKRNGTKKVYSSSARHDWRGGYTVGASAPTPWGGVNVYSASSSAFSRVVATGAWQKWE